MLEYRILPPLLFVVSILLNVLVECWDTRLTRGASGEFGRAPTRPGVATARVFAFALLYSSLLLSILVRF